VQYVTFKNDPTGRCLLRNLERLLLSLALGMISVFVVGSIHGAVALNAELTLFRTIQTSDLRDNPMIGSSAIAFSLWSSQRIGYYRQTLARQFDPPLALLRISRVGLEAPFPEGTIDSVLSHVVGHIPGTSLPRQVRAVGIANHNYRVTQILVVNTTDVSILQSHSIPSMTLVTCSPFYFVDSVAQRYVVEASLEPSASSKKGESKSTQKVSG
jgi:sortase A